MHDFQSKRARLQISKAKSCGLWLTFTAQAVFEQAYATRADITASVQANEVVWLARSHPSTRLLPELISPVHAPRRCWSCSNGFFRASALLRTGLQGASSWAGCSGLQMVSPAVLSCQTLKEPASITHKRWTKTAFPPLLGCDAGIDGVDQTRMGYVLSAIEQVRHVLCRSVRRDRGILTLVSHLSLCTFIV